MKLTEGGKLQRPNICWICKRTPAIGTPVIDTEKYFDGFPTNLQGRQYVCEKCVGEMAKFFDLADAETVAIARHEADVAAQILRGLKLRLDSVLSDLRDVAINPGLLMDEANGSIRKESPIGERASEGSPSEEVKEVDNIKGNPSDVSSKDRPTRNPNRSSTGGHRKAKVAVESSETEA